MTTPTRGYPAPQPPSLEDLDSSRFPTPPGGYPYTNQPPLYNPPYYPPYGGAPMPPEPQRRTQAQPLEFLSPLPKEPPKIKFNGRTYAILPKIYTESRIPDPAIAKPFTDLIVVVLKYGIPALEAKLKTKITSLDNLKIIKEVDNDDPDSDKKEPGKLIIQYKTNGQKKPQEVIIDDSFELSKQDQTEVCMLLDNKTNCQGCHTDHNTVMKIYDQAIDILKTAKAKHDKEVAPYSTILKPVSYEDLPESFKTKNPKVEEKNKDKGTQAKDKEEPTQDHKKTTNESQKSPSSPIKTESFKSKPPEPLGGLVKLNGSESGKIEYFQEELDHAPSITQNKITSDTQGLHLSRWVDYLFNGTLRTLGTNQQEKTIDRSVTPIIFNIDEARNILRKMKSSAKEGNLQDFAQKFTDKEQVFIKRLLLLIKKQEKEPNFNLFSLLGSFAFTFKKGEEILAEFSPPENFTTEDPLITLISEYLKKVDLK